MQNDLFKTAQLEGISLGGGNRFKVVEDSNAELCKKSHVEIYDVLKCSFVACFNGEQFPWENIPSTLHVTFGLNIGRTLWTWFLCDDTKAYFRSGHWGGNFCLIFSKLDARHQRTERVPMMACHSQLRKPFEECQPTFAKEASTGFTKR